MDPTTTHILEDLTDTLGSARQEYLATLNPEIVAAWEADRAAEGALIAAAREDPNVFNQYVMEDPDTGLTFEQAPIHVQWQDALSKYRSVMVVVSRGHGKTSQITIARVLWEIGHNVDIRVKIVCHSDGEAVKRLDAIKAYIDTSSKYQKVFPHVRRAEAMLSGGRESKKSEKWAKHTITVARNSISPDPTVEAKGVLSAATGGRANLIVFDDIVDERNALQQPALRDTVKEAFRNTWVNLLHPGGRIWYPCTLWHEDDLTHELIEENEQKSGGTIRFHILKDSVGRNEDGTLELLWPEKWTEEELKDRESMIGTRAFERAYLNIAISRDETLFPEEAILGCRVFGQRAEEILEKVGVAPELVFMGVDLSASIHSKKASYTVIFTGAVIPGTNTKVPLSITRGRFTSPETASLIVDAYKTWNPKIIWVETNAYQVALLQWIEEVFGRMEIPIIGKATGGEVLSTAVGLPTLATAFHNKSWAIPYPEPHERGCMCGTCIWIKELVNFPLGKHKDTVMASWFFMQAVREGMEFAARFDDLSILPAGQVGTRRRRSGVPTAEETGLEILTPAEWDKKYGGAKSHGA